MLANINPWQEDKGKIGEQRLKNRHKPPRNLPQLRAKLAKTAKKIPLKIKGIEKLKVENIKRRFMFLAKNFVDCQVFNKTRLENDTKNATSRNKAIMR